MALILFDDERARAWIPLSVTRPAGELLFGCLTLRERSERFWSEACVGHVTDPRLDAFTESGAAPALDSDARDSTLGASTGAPRILFSSRAVPDFAPAPPVRRAGGPNHPRPDRRLDSSRRDRPRPARTTS